MRTARFVTAPDGGRWKVGRRWMNRPVPKLWRGPKWHKARDEAGEDAGWLQTFDVLPNVATDGDDLLVGVAFAVGAVIAVALFVFVLLPLIGIAIEIALLVMLFSSGVLGRVFLRRPWIVEATSLDGDATSAFAVKGWLRSRRAIRELAGAIEATGLPSGLVEAERVASASV